LNSSFIFFYSFSSASALSFSAIKAEALSSACFDSSMASFFSLSANSLAVSYITATGSGLSSGYSSGNWFASMFNASSASGSILMSADV